MIKTIKTENIPIKLWLEDIEKGALQQAKNLANFPYAYKHIAIMPDAHQGYGMPIGGVMATKEVIIPNAVGVDIGCGMCTVKTKLTEIKREDLKKIMSLIRQKVPTGFKHHKKPQNRNLMPNIKNKANLPVVLREYNNALTQLGTLGGGNHFIDILKGDDNHIYIMIHSGSRNLGKQVADHYYEKAVQLRSKYNSEIPENWKLDYLKVNSKEGEQYLTEMQYCVDFAFANRKLMLNRTINSFKEVLDLDDSYFNEMINIAHNYASEELHFNNEVWVHRKGATSAKKGEIGIIPGSQGTESYIVEGKGNPESFKSCSHGAGRILSRTKAKKTLNLKKESKQLENQGILHSIRGQEDLDEAPGAYRNIGLVMNNQKDLVNIKVELNPIAIVK